MDIIDAGKSLRTATKLQHALTVPEHIDLQDALAAEHPRCTGRPQEAVMHKSVVQAVGGCTNIALVGSSLLPSKRWLIGSVSDDPYDFRTRVVVDKEQGGLKYVATELRSLSGKGMEARGFVVTEGEHGRGVNEAGLGFAWTFVKELNPPAVAQGLTSGDFSKLLLARCASVDDALCLVDGVSRNFSGVWLLADAQGALAQVEIARRAFLVTKRLSIEDGGVAVNVNCYQEMREYQDPYGSMDVESAPNASRFNAGMASLAQIEGEAGLADAARVLTDHRNIREPLAQEPWMWPGQGFSICNHGSTFGTVSAEIIDPVSRTLWYCYGWPCGEAPTDRGQLYQERSWGRFLPFCVDSLATGCYTTLLGELTPLAVKQVEFREVLYVFSP